MMAEKFNFKKNPFAGGRFGGTTISPPVKRSLEKKKVSPPDSEGLRMVRKLASGFLNSPSRARPSGVKIPAGRRPSVTKPSAAAVKRATNTVRRKDTKKSTNTSKTATGNLLKPSVFLSMKKSASFSFGSNTLTPPPELKSELSPSEVAFHLRALVGKTANTPSEKYQILEERDKILRKGRAKISDVNRAAAMQGTCGDMCPEKEIYQRQTQKRMSKFELDPVTGEVDHGRAVKDYSRSSADQGEPLPHELRPGHVLAITMDYLITEIARDAPDNDTDLRIWYDFLWETTRAIRKEITQQMITDEIAVDLMEKCVRFHIFAAHHLCHLETADFDQRMNTENLTKSLQSLRHLYEDLGKSGDPCLNECEFRAYDVLLNLSDTDILQQVLSYKEEVRHSGEVSLALKLFTAYQSNNYIRFFRIIRDRATYLQASVAHRYFNVIRKKAILTIAKSYGTNFKMAVNDLVRMLCFENGIEALEFCALYGFHHSVEDGTQLILKRTKFGEPKNPPPIKRADILIGDKRVGCTVGELLAGARLYPVDLPEPVISFDENNRYRYDPVIVPYLREQPDLVTSAETTERQEEEEEERILEDQKISSAEYHKIVKSLGWNLLEDLIKKEVNNVIVHEYVVDFVEKSVDQMMREIAVETYEFEYQSEMVRRRNEYKRRLQEMNERNSYQLLEKITDEVVLGKVKEYGLRQILFEQLEKKRKQVQEICSEFDGELFGSYLDSLISQLSVNILEFEIEKRRQKLETIRKNLDRLWLMQFTERWKLYAKKKAKQRRDLEDFPLTPTYDVLACAKKWSPATGRRFSLPFDLNKTVESITDSNLEWSLICRFGPETMEKIDSLRHRCDCRRLKEAFDRWRAQTRINSYMRNALENFPPCPVSLVAEKSCMPASKKVRVSITSPLEEHFKIMNDSTFIDIDRISPIEPSFDQASISPSKFVVKSKNISSDTITWRSNDVELMMEQFKEKLKQESSCLSEDETHWKEMLSDQSI